MAWYGNHVDSSKKLDQLIDQTPSLQQLLNYPDFIQQLKAYNPKLLDYLTNSNTVMMELINYISAPPKQKDDDERKYKLPTLSMQMIQSEAMCILNGFFRQQPKRKTKYFILMFEELLKSSNKVQGQVLPILSGYFLRVSICLLNNKYKQTIDTIYENPQLINLLLQNCQNLSITNTLQVFLNLDLTKNSQLIQERINTKLQVINKIVRIIDQSVEERKKLTNKTNSEQQIYSIRVENLASVLIQLFEKYYLIADGKLMVDQILYQENHIKTFFKSIFDRQSDISISLLNILISIVKFYTFSSLNAEQYSNQDHINKNQQKLESQPAVQLLIEIIQNLVAQLTKCKNITIYETKTVELMNIIISLSSHKIFNCVRNCKYLEIIIQLMFRFQNCNLFGQMVQKLFLMIFRTQKIINQEIKHYIFCEAKIIDLTAARYLSLFQNDEQIAASMSNSYRRKGFFGHLMKIMKIYSGIQTTDEQIINAIKIKSQVWNKISRLILKPYETINTKQLGSYENIPQRIQNQFIVKSIIGINDSSRIRKQAQNTRLIDQINREQAIQNIKTLQNPVTSETKIQGENIYHSHQQKQTIQVVQNKEDQFFNPPTQNTLGKIPTSPRFVAQKKQSTGSSKQQDEQNNAQNRANINSPPPLQKKAASYNDFIERQKVRAGTQITKQRSRSKQRALSKGKTKITSPSPIKRVNKWAQSTDQKVQVKQEKQKQVKQKISLTGGVKVSTQQRNLPKIPMHKKGINVSSTSSQSLKQQNHNKSMQLQRKEESQVSQNSLMSNKSMPNLQQLKKIRMFTHFDPPAKRQYRKITQDDKNLFDMIGIVYS